jgi:hypothetical protein
LMFVMASEIMSAAGPNFSAMHNTTFPLIIVLFSASGEQL